MQMSTTRLSALVRCTCAALNAQFTDFRLGEMFSHFPQYFGAFFSCD
ncbi:hypothetical protein [Zooshikella sp. RANM57]